MAPRMVTRSSSRKSPSLLRRLHNHNHFIYQNPPRLTEKIKKEILRCKRTLESESHYDPTCYQEDPAGTLALDLAYYLISKFPKCGIKLEGVKKWIGRYSWISERGGIPPGKTGRELFDEIRLESQNATHPASSPEVASFLQPPASVLTPPSTEEEATPEYLSAESSNSAPRNTPGLSSQESTYRGPIKLTIKLPNSKPNKEPSKRKLKLRSMERRLALLETIVLDFMKTIKHLHAVEVGQDEVLITPPPSPSRQDNPVENQNDLETVLTQMKKQVRLRKSHIRNEAYLHKNVKSEPGSRIMSQQNSLVEGADLL